MPRARHLIHQEAPNPAMAKRARGSVRPGQRRPIDKRPAAPASSKAAAAPKPAGLSDAEVERAAQIEAEMVAQERALEESRKRTKERTAASREYVPVSAAGFAAAEAKEYAYVARDVRRILAVGALELAILAVIYVLVDVVEVVKI
jgi:hypothetical protein